MITEPVPPYRSCIQGYVWHDKQRIKITHEDEEMLDSKLTHFGTGCEQLPSTSPQQFSRSNMKYPTSPK